MLNSLKGRSPGYYVIDMYSDMVHRGPYKHEETAGAVRAEMESDASEEQNEVWNLGIVLQDIAPTNPEPKTLKSSRHENLELHAMEACLSGDGVASKPRPRIPPIRQRKMCVRAENIGRSACLCVLPKNPSELAAMKRYVKYSKSIEYLCKIAQSLNNTVNEDDQGERLAFTSVDMIPRANRTVIFKLIASVVPRMPLLMYDAISQDGSYVVDTYRRASWEILGAPIGTGFNYQERYRP